MSSNVIQLETKGPKRLKGPKGLKGPKRLKGPNALAAANIACRRVVVINYATPRAISFSSFHDRTPLDP